MITIKKIAQLANVSSGTVDRVIHKRGQVTQENIDKVTAIIEKYDYKINIHASNLALNKKYKIAICIPKNNKLEYWKLPIIGIQKAAEEYKNSGISIDYFYYDYTSLSFINTCGELLNADFDGLLIAPIFYNESLIFLNEFKKKNIPIILIDSNVEDIPNRTFIGQDAFQGGVLSGKLTSLGISNKKANILIVKITREIDNTSIYPQRIKGFYSYFKNKIEFKNYKFKEVNIEEFGNGKITKKMFEGIDALFIPNSRAYLIAEFVKKNKIEGITIVGYDLLKKNIEYLNNGVINFLINQNPEHQGYLGVSYLYKKLVLKEEINIENYMPLEIIVKENYGVK
ncbi:substrate-binding domain-containing protein [Flavobacterium sp.]|uniref:substrate-binding domain-containing protein n=1 Tax=Flavobacterium sp. TaxID=239 RepID=UPI003BD56B95